MINLGSTSISKAYVGATAVSKIYLGSAQVWASGLSAMRMNKSGADQLVNGTAQLTGFIADAAYPGTTIVSDRLVVSDAVASKLITYGSRIPVNGQGFVNIHLMKNETSLANFQISSNTSAVTSTFTTSLAAGDTIWLRAVTSFGSKNFIGSSETFVSWEAT